jgi:hypothetical protein
MKSTILLTTALLAVLMTSGCATKMYGKQGEVTRFEKETMTCREADLEIAKVEGFKAYVHQESKFSWRDAAAVFGDLYIGNYLEKKSALKSADKRLEQLKTIKTQKQC